MENLFIHIQEVGRIWGLRLEREIWIPFKKKGKFLLLIHSEYQCPSWNQTQRERALME